MLAACSEFNVIGGKTLFIWAVVAAERENDATLRDTMGACASMLTAVGIVRYEATGPCSNSIESLT